MTNGKNLILFRLFSDMSVQVCVYACFGKSKISQRKPREKSVHLYGKLHLRNLRHSECLNLICFNGAAGIFIHSTAFSTQVWLYTL